MTIEQFVRFVLLHLHLGNRGPQPKLSLYAIFNYILKLLYLGCQWQELPIATDENGQPEIHYTRIYRAFRRFEFHGCFDHIFVASVSVLHQEELLDLPIIHGDGTTTAAKKGGDNLGFSGHKLLYLRFSFVRLIFHFYPSQNPQLVLGYLDRNYLR